MQPGRLGLEVGGEGCWFLGRFFSSIFELEIILVKLARDLTRPIGTSKKVALRFRGNPLKFEENPGG